MPKKLNEIQTSEAQTVLAIGPSGSGKSIAMCSYPAPVLNISLDRRIRSIAEYYRGTDKFNQISLEQPTTFDELNKIVDDLETYCPYKTVIIDPLINLSQMLIQYSTLLQGKDKGKKRGVIDVAGVEDYLVETKGITDIIFNAKLAQEKHEFNLIFVAHLLTITHYKVGGAVSHTTQDILTAGRKIAAFIPTQFDEIYYFFVETIEGKPRYKVRTFNDGEIAARSSFLSMPEELEWTDSLDFYGGISKFFGPKAESKKEGEQSATE